MTDNTFTPTRSWLFTPATRPDRFAKASAVSADVIILDLEDAVAPNDKDRARITALDYLRSGKTDGVRRALRINGLDTRAGIADLNALLETGAAPDYVVLPKTETAPPSGSTYAYIDYVLTNTGTKPALLADPYPGDLFLPKSLVPAADQDRCMPQPGVKDGYCTLPNDSKIIAYLNGSTPPVTQNGSQFMPVGASYLVRVATNVPVSTTVKRSDLSLYVWQAVYIPDRKAVAVPFA